MNTQPENQTPFRAFLRDERGAIAILMTVALPVLVGFMTLAVDVAYIHAEQDQLQTTADAAALAGTQWVGLYTGSSSTPCTAAYAGTKTAGFEFCYYATQVANANISGVLPVGNITVGTWTSGTGTFTPLISGNTPNSVQVTTVMNSTNGNSLSLFFAPMLAGLKGDTGYKTVGLYGKATAAFTSTNGGGVGSGVNAVSNMIVATDISSSFSNFISPAQTAIKQCIKDFASTGTANSYFGLTLFTGNSPQSAVAGRTVSSSYLPTSSSVPPMPVTMPTTVPTGGFLPYNWSGSGSNPSGITITSAQQTNPWAALASATSTNFQTNLDNETTAIQDGNSGSFTSANPQYNLSGSNIAAGMQSAINQLCPASGCSAGSSQMVIITDGIPNCSLNTGRGSIGTSQVPNTAGTVGTLSQSCSASAPNTGSPWYTGQDGELLLESQQMAAYAGALGITVSTIYLSSADNGSTIGPDGNSHLVELENLTNFGNNALKAKLGTNALIGQFFNDTSASASSLDSFLQNICVGGVNGKAPRLVM